MIPKFHNNEKVLCHKKEDTPDTYRVATILDCKDLQGNVQYYVRYPDYNTRLDEWTSENNIVKYSTKYKIIRPHQSEDKSSRMVTRAVRSQNVYMLEKEGEQQGGNGPVVEHETTVRTKNISVVTFGEYDLSTWYFSPYPGKYGTVDHLYICQHCLKYMSKSKTYQQHRNKCQYFFPPGLLIYRDPETKLAFFEVDGAEAKMFCQSLCLLSKLFLDHKTLYYDVEPFYFYVLCTFELNNTTQREEYQIVGYFSKEKASPDGYNLSCLMVLPHCQRKGYGKMLISMSYELSRIEGLPGSPENH
ncbi:Histone acetyltransferase [Entamoeba marina]